MIYRDSLVFLGNPFHFCPQLFDPLFDCKKFIPTGHGLQVFPEVFQGDLVRGDPFQVGPADGPGQGCAFTSPQGKDTDRGGAAAVSDPVDVDPALPFVFAHICRVALGRKFGQSKMCLMEKKLKIIKYSRLR